MQVPAYLDDPLWVVDHPPDCQIQAVQVGTRGEAQGVKDINDGQRTVRQWQQFVDLIDGLEVTHFSTDKLVRTPPYPANHEDRTTHLGAQFFDPRYPRPPTRVSQRPHGCSNTTVMAQILVGGRVHLLDRIPRL